MAAGSAKNSSVSTRLGNKLQVIELADINNQHISTLNTSGWIADLVNTGKTHLLDELFQSVISPTDKVRTYLGKPVSIDFFKDPNYWYDYELNLDIFAASEKLGIDPISLGKCTVYNNLYSKGSVILSIVNMIGIGPALQGVQRVNGKYNKSKTVKISQVSDTGGVVELHYQPGFSHTPYLTKQNIGCYLAVLEYLQYQNVTFSILTDQFYPDVPTGYSRIQFHWQKRFFFNRLLDPITDFLADKVFGRYIRTNKCLHKYHANLIQNYEYQLSIKENLLSDIEQTHANQLEQQQRVIDMQSQQLIEAQAELNSAHQQEKHKIECWFEEHVSKQSIKASDLASYIGMSESVMNRKIKLFFGSSFKKMLVAKRIAEAKQMLISKSPTQTAYSTGFRTPSHFSEVFKKEVGSTPSEFANQSHEAIKPNVEIR